MKKLNVAIVGVGHLGSRHLKVYDTLRNKVNLVGICDVKKARTKKLADHYKVDLYTNYKDLTGKIDAVNICTPTSTHHEIAKYFLQNGIHTFVEKPMTLTVDEADDLIELAQAKKLKLQIGHVERFNAAFQSLKFFTKKPLFIECHRLNRFPNRSLDIGVVMDLMIHDIDIILGLVKSPVKDIHAVGLKVLTPLEDIANVRIIFENGCVCNVTASRVSEEVVRKIRIFQRSTYISLNYVEQEAFIYKKVGKLILKHALPIEKEEPLKQELEHFIECVQKNRQPLVSGVEGREALKVCLAIGRQIRDLWEQTKNM